MSLLRFLPAGLMATLIGLGGCANLPGPGAVAPVSTATQPSTQPNSDTPTALPGTTAATGTDAAATSAASTVAGTVPPQDTSTAPPAGPPLDPLRPDARVDLNDRAARTDLWVRVRKGFAMPDLDSEYVRDRERWYSTRPDYVARMTERGSRYLFHIVEEVEKRGMPTELALLPFIESAFNPQAMSSAKASGMWQFMPGTGRNFELKQNVFRDDRRDVLASTRAALDYLGKLYGMFGDWHLALAAYNWGEGSVQRAIARNQRAGLPTDYASLRMPDETRYYVPKLQAVKNIVARPAEFGITLPAVDNHPYFLSVPIERDMDVDLAARLSGLSVEEFKTLNPQMNKPVILAAGTPQVLLPYDNANQFVRLVPQHKGSFATWTAWVAPKTLRPADAAKQVGMSEAALREVNRIPARMLVKAGSTLLVPRAAHRQTDVSEHLADNAMMSLTPDAPATRRVAFKAGKKGESVAAVAHRYRVNAAQVAQWNGVTTSSNFKAGQTVVVYVAGKAARASNHAPTRTSARAGAHTAKAHNSTRVATKKHATRQMNVARK